MKRLLFIWLCGAASFGGFAQGPAGGKEQEPATTYQETPELVNDLVHTRLDARFDYTKSYLNGKVWLTLKPHFYATDSLTLDAKGMEIRQVALVKNGKNTPLKFTYNGLKLNIRLDRLYKGGENYTIWIDYTAKPNEYNAQGSAAIAGAKGLYFINPLGEEKAKPTQIWTQGETEATSVYVPIIDKPNQKTTQEFNLTVPAKYVSLSNGKLVSQKTNNDGTRTDSWKMDLPHAPYLFFIGVGDFSVTKDTYKGKEVSYYVEKEYGPVARRIFGNTPQMMQFFYSITGVEYPWNKYSQMTARDYVSGAMENTTATLHQESAQQDARELVDGNRWEDIIAHELFHQWFGDLVTTESWSNLTLNESFANYSEYLWNEYKYGKDAADAHNYQDMQGYLMSGSEEKQLVRYNYHDKEEMFDAVSYNKGGRILHMLRNFIGDSAFYKGMNTYLNNNKFKSAEAHQLRLAFEEVTGKDLNWFFNQWYFNSGHPKLTINQSYDPATKQARVIVRQTGRTFRLPVALDVYAGGERMRHNVWLQQAADTFVFAEPSRPDLINFDAEKVLLAEKTENKSLDQYLFQYKNARNYMDRREAIDAAAKQQGQQKAVELLMLALKDPFHGLRSHAIGELDLTKEALKTLAEPTLAGIAKSDAKSTVRAAAIKKLGDYRFARYVPMYTAALSDSSYSVAGSALEAIGKVDTATAVREAKRLVSQPAKGQLADAISRIMIQFGDESSAAFIIKSFEDMPAGQQKFEMVEPLAAFLAKVQSMETFRRGVDAIIELRDQIPAPYNAQTSPYIDGMLRNVQRAKGTGGQKELGDYIETKLVKPAGK